MGLGNNTLETNGTTEVLFTNKFFMRKGFGNPSHEKICKGGTSKGGNRMYPELPQDMGKI